MKTRDIVFSLSAMILLIRPSSGRPYPGCPIQPLEGWPIPTNCVYGIAEDICGRKSCAKGPGQRCNSRKFRKMGNCGDGMYCHCGLCMGCSLSTFSCFENTCYFAMG